ncbi:MAG TPA: hypothetical protein PK198_12910, partial [Saprospiraceae bacterium]|nr:hypothetical protein [Saprospiraceae bacterium]
MIRWKHWEYWPSWAYYFPMLAYYPWLALKARHLCFFTAANPGIYTGGMGMESKYETLMKIPAEWRPKTILALPGESTESLSLRLEQAGIGFPLIAKPDMGLRGFLVSKIYDLAALQTLLEKHPVPFVLQEFISKKNEFGVFYHRFPDEEQGHITSLTFKEFLHVVGNGQDTLRQLIAAHPRALLQWERLSKSHAEKMEIIPPAGEIVPLGEIGNHSKGTRFINAAAHIDDTLRESFDRMVDEVAAMIEPFAHRAAIQGQIEHLHMLGTSGTVTTLAGVHLGLPKYDRRRVDGAWLGANEVDVIL